MTEEVCDLKDKKCIPCQGGVPPLPIDETKKLLSKIHQDWELTHDNTRIIRKFTFKNFKPAMDLAHTFGEIAEEQGHHPELTLGWGHLEVEVWTHKINALVESDFIYAAKVDEAFEKYMNK